MKTYKQTTSRLYSEDKPTYLKYCCMNYFVNSVRCRLPFEVTFDTMNLVSLNFSYGGRDYLLQLQLGEFESLMSYALMHIDDVV